MNVFDAIRLRALRDVVKGDDADYAMRQIFRWYSKTFHTPLHVVDDLPIEHILQTYWEAQYEDMDEQKLDSEVVELTKTDAQRKAEDKAWDAQQAEEVEFAKMVGQSDKPKDTSKLSDLKTEPIKPLVPETPQPTSSIEAATEKLNQMNEILSNIKELPEDVHMSFVSEDDMSELLEEDSIVAPVKPK